MVGVRGGLVGWLISREQGAFPGLTWCRPSARDYLCAHLSLSSQN